MTVITAKTTKREETFYFNPPLPPAKGMKLLRFSCLGPFSRRITCEIVDPFSHYSNLERDKIEPVRLIAYTGCFSKKNEEGLFYITCPEKFPTVKAQTSKDPINSIKISIESILRPSVPERYHICYICLKIYH